MLKLVVHIIVYTRYIEASQPFYGSEAPDDGQKDCPKHIVIITNNKNWNSVHFLVLFTRNLSRCTFIQS